MTWLQILVHASIIATFVGVGIAVAAYFNGKHIKEGVIKLSEQILKVSEQISKLGEELGKILAQMQKTAEQRHLEIIELLKNIGSNKK